MSYKPDEKDWMDYLYGELEGEDKERFEQYLIQNPSAQKELEKFKGLREVLSHAEDKEVIAPPIVLGETRQRFIWNAPYFKTIISIAASLILVMLCAKLLDIRVSKSDNQFTLSFGEPPKVETPVEIPDASLTQDQVQQMINASLENNNVAMQSNWKENEARLTASIRKNLSINSEKVDQLVRQASMASQEQIQQYVLGMQDQNMKVVKDYFQLTSAEQKKYIENLLVDFASYLQQQRNNDLQLVETRLNSIEKNTNIFKQETEQILTSIISSVGTNTNKEIKN